MSRWQQYFAVGVVYQLDAALGMQVTRFKDHLRKQNRFLTTSATLSTRRKEHNAALYLGDMQTIAIIAIMSPTLTKTCTSSTLAIPRNSTLHSTQELQFDNLLRKRV